MMKKMLKQLTALLLCLSLSMGSLLSVHADDENGVTFSVELDTPTIKTSSVEQTVVMRLMASAPVTVDGIGFKVTKDDALTIAGITGGEGIGAYDSLATNLENGTAGWSSPSSENVSGVIELAVITFTVPANIASGSYVVGITSLELTKDYGDIWENGASASTTLTVEAEEATEGYSAGLKADKASVENGGQVRITVNAAHGSKNVFNADQEVITYDSDKLIFNKNESALGDAEVEDDENGTLKIVNYGDDRIFGDIYTLVFDAKATGVAAVTLSSAAFTDVAGASSGDLVSASVSPATVNLTITNKSFTVTFPQELAGIIEGNTSVADGEAYEFKVLDTNYTYVFSGTMGEQVATITTQDGKNFTVEAVTGDLTIDLYSKTPKSYKVTIEGSGAEDVKAKDGTEVGNTATYATDYVFKVDAKASYGYAVSVTIGGTSYTGYTSQDNVYTIPGTVITGEIVVNVVKSATEAAVSVTGDGAGIATGFNPVAEIGKTYTLTVNPQSGYFYTVTATMGGATIELTTNTEKTQYTTPEVTGTVVFTIDRTVDTSSVEVKNKVTIQNGTVYAVTYKEDLGDGRVPTYDGTPMYWSENHKAYIYLVIGTTLSADDAKTKIGITEQAAVSVAASGDINGSGKMDASDAQYVWNMYNAKYSAFTEDVTMIEFIRADRNADYKIDMDDAAAIVSEILVSQNN